MPSDPMTRKVQTIIGRYVKPELESLGFRRHEPGTWACNHGDAVWVFCYESGWMARPEWIDLSVTLAVGYRSVNEFVSRVPRDILIGSCDTEVPVAVVADLAWLNTEWKDEALNEWRTRADSPPAEVGREIVAGVRLWGVPFWKRFTSFDAVGPFLDLPLEKRPPYITTIVVMKYAAHEWLQGRREAALKRLEDEMDAIGPGGHRHVKDFYHWLLSKSRSHPETIH